MKISEIIVVEKLNDLIRKHIAYEIIDSGAEMSEWVSLKIWWSLIVVILREKQAMS